MIVVSTKADLNNQVNLFKAKRLVVGFVPTMGALHDGHISLISQAKRVCDVVIASVFVNPIQFNDTSDFDNYPSTIEEDKLALKNAGCDLVFIPSTEEMYPEEPKESYDFGFMETVMEGACRSGHFNGVAVVVKRLFDMVSPDKAFFGEKDFQQLAIIKELVRLESLPIEIVPCTTIREKDGLAMSSRNVRLSDEQRKSSVRISQALKMSVEGEFGSVPSIIKAKAIEYISIDSNLNVEYFEVVDSDSLIAKNDSDSLEKAIACTAVFAGEVRLIDNMSWNVAQ